MAYVYEASAEVEASPQEVWAVLVDLPAYGEWNPFTVEVVSTLTPGDRVWLRVDLGWVTLWQAETVRQVSPPERLVWGLGVGPLLWAERVQTVRARDSGSTYHTSDRIGGLLSPLVHLLFGGPVGRGFTRMASALQGRMEETRSPL